MYLAPNLKWAMKKALRRIPLAVPRRLRHSECVDRFALRQAVVDTPGDPLLRLHYARALRAAGHRTAAWWEVQAARRLGSEPPPEAEGWFSFENPAGLVWTLTPLVTPQGGVVRADVPDPFFPGAAATDGVRTLPLALLLGRFCAACDEHGEGVCTDCGGTGWKPSLLGDDELPCPERDTCNRCGGSKYVVNVYRAARGECRHPNLVGEAKGSPWTLERCADCGLASMTAFPLWSHVWACARCGLFDCRCPTG